MKKILAVYLPVTMKLYVEGQDGVSEIKPAIANGHFWYWQVVFDNGEWLDITAPAILKHSNTE